MRIRVCPNSFNPRPSVKTGELHYELVRMERVIVSIHARQ